MATRTDLGKIIITNGGEYDPEAVYEEMTFVLYNNSTYLALQTVSGVEPVDDRVNWQLMAKGFAGSEFEIEGYVYVENEEVEPDVGEPALNADKLAGQPPEYYAPQHEITDAFSEIKFYPAGDYCFYLNRLFRFTTDKEPGPWNGTAVVPVTIAGELKSVMGGVAELNSDFSSVSDRLIRGNGYTSLNVESLKDGGYHRLQINEDGSAGVYHYDPDSGKSGDKIALKSDFYPENMSKKSLKTISKSGWYMGAQITELTDKGISSSVWFNIFAVYQADKIWSFVFLGLDGSRYTGVIRGEGGLESFKAF